jgi:hypothetical protein
MISANLWAPDGSLVGTIPCPREGTVRVGNLVVCGSHALIAVGDVPGKFSRVEVFVPSYDHPRRREQ